MKLPGDGEIPSLRTMPLSYNGLLRLFCTQDTGVRFLSAAPYPFSLAWSKARVSKTRIGGSNPSAGAISMPD